MVVFLGPVVQPWYVLWGLTVLAATRLSRRIVLVAAGGSFWLSMMIAPQGSNLFLELAPIAAMAAAAIVATVAVLGARTGGDGPDAVGSPPRREPVASLP